MISKYCLLGKLKRKGDKKMKNVDVVKKFGAEGFINVVEAIFDFEKMKFESIRGEEFYPTGETRFYPIIDALMENALAFAEADSIKNHQDAVSISSNVTSVKQCEEGSIPYRSPVLFITKNQSINKTVDENGNVSFYHVDIEGRFSKPLFTLSDNKKVYVSCTFFRTNFPIVRIYKIKEGAEVDPNMIYFEPETIIINSNNITTRSEAHADIFDKLFDSRAWEGYIETYKHKVLTEFAPQINIVKDFDVYKVKE